MSYITVITKADIVCVLLKSQVYLNPLKKAELKTFESPIEDLKHRFVCSGIVTSPTLQKVVCRHVVINLFSLCYVHDCV